MDTLPTRRSTTTSFRVLAALAAVAAGFAGGRLTGGSPPEPAPAALVTAGSEASATASPAEVIDGAVDSIVSVETLRHTGPFGEQVGGTGSGVVIRDDGIVLTNAHVIEGASEIEVTDSDGERRFDATVVGSDAEHDLAILKVEAAGLSAIPIGSSGDLALGDSVIALGHPLGLGTTATEGIVSGLDRSIQVPDGPFGVNQLSGLLQTDAAINPGNSGGALLDAEGRLVGINTAAASAASAENVGFAVAIDEALPIVEAMLHDV